MKYCSQLVTGIFVATIAASPAWSGPNVFANFGETLTLNGTVGNEAGNAPNADPFTLGVFSSGNECLRIAVISQDADLEATLVAPGGRIWQDDDSNGSFRPLIKAITPPVRGWYELAVSQFAGTVVHANFTFQISRFLTTDSRCNPPTTPRAFGPTALKPGQVHRSSPAGSP
jgi:hypothetical protein